MTDTTLANALRAAGADYVYLPGSADYAAELAAFNPNVRHQPDAVVAARTPLDVAAAIAVASGHGVDVIPLGLGHGVLRDADGGIAISTRGLASVRLDLENRTARVGAGTSWAEVLETVTPHGLAPLCGSAPGVGVIGYVLGGGMGPIARSHGFAADHVQSIEIVTPADGYIVATPEQHSDLFWGLRGGGKLGFGVVVAVTLDLFPIETLYGGGMFFAAEDAKAVLDAWAVWSRDLPLCVSTSVAMVRVPPLPELPEPIRGKFVLHLRFADLDTADDAEARLAAIRSVATPLIDYIGEMPYAAIGAIHQDPVVGTPVTEGGVTLSALPQEAVDALWAVAGDAAEVPLLAVELRLLGGKVGEAPLDANAVGGRDGAYSLFVVSAPIPELLETVLPQVIGGVFSAVEEWHATELLTNFVGRANGPDALRRSWSPEVLQRLESIRDAADPDGIFAAKTAILA
ncbi:MAG TPA: FAD-binding oxidoreductase [Naasia sp.]|jgi:FAD/FMN-containing dehydrogenase